MYILKTASLFIYEIFYPSASIIPEVTREHTSLMIYYILHHM